MTKTSNTEEVADPTIEAEPETETPVRTSGRGNMGGLALVVAAVALVVGAAAVAIHVRPQLLGPMAAPAYDPAPQQAAVAALGGRLDSVEGRLADALKSLEDLQVRQASLSTMAGQMDTLVQEMDAVAGRLDSARRRIDTVAAGVRDADVSERVEALTGQLQTFEEAVSGAEVGTGQVEERLAANLAELGKRLDTIAARTRLLEVVQPDHVAGAAAVALAVGQLRVAVLDGQPYSAPLTNVKTLLAAEGSPTTDIAETLRALEREASVGVMTMAALRQGLSDQSAVILRAGTSEATGWMDQTLRRLATVVTVRRTGEVSGSGAEAHLARAEARLQAGSLEAAVTELSGLAGAAADAAASWLAAARTRLAVESALSELEVYAVSRVADIHDATRPDRMAQ